MSMAWGRLQQLEHLVEARRVARPRRADREEPADVAGQQVTREQRLARAHPVAVAPDRVDLTVVRDEAVRVRQRPAREGVGAEAAVHQRECGLVPRVVQVGEVRRELVRREHALVEQGARGQRCDVDARLALDPLAGAEGRPLERHPGQQLPRHRVRRRDDELAQPGLDTRRGGPDGGGVDRHVPPRQQVEPLVPHDALDRAHRLVTGAGLLREEGRADRVGPGRRQRHVEHAPQQRVGHLGQDAGAVTGRRVAARGTSVVEVAQRGEPLAEHLVAAAAVHVHDEGDTAGVVLEGGVVQALLAHASSSLLGRG